MTNICHIQKQHFIKMVPPEPARFLQADPLKYIFNSTEELDPVSPSTQEIKDTVYNLWISTKKKFKAMEPYQPLTSTITILGKAVWKLRMKRNIIRSIQRDKNKLRILESIHRSEIKNCSKKITELQKEIRKKKEDLFHSEFAIAQLGSLAFPHPGSNVWNSINTLSHRLLSMRRICLMKAPMAAVLGAVSVAGTTISLLKQTGLVDEDSSFCHVVLGASFIGWGIETGIMIKKWLFNR